MVNRRVLDVPGGAANVVLLTDPVSMRSVAPALMPISCCTPNRDYGVTELPQQINVPPTTLHREIERLEAAGLLGSRAVGRSRLLRA